MIFFEKIVDFQSTKYYIEKVDCESTHKQKGGEGVTNTKLLEKKIADSGYKKSYIAKAIGLKSAFGLSNKINNKTEFKASEINALCELLKIESAEEKEAIFFAV